MFNKILITLFLILISFTATSNEKNKKETNNLKVYNSNKALEKSDMGLSSEISDKELSRVRRELASRGNIDEFVVKSWTDRLLEKIKNFFFKQVVD